MVQDGPKVLCILAWAVVNKVKLIIPHKILFKRFEKLRNRNKSVKGNRKGMGGNTTASQNYVPKSLSHSHGTK